MQRLYNLVISLFQCTENRHLTSTLELREVQDMKRDKDSLMKRSPSSPAGGLCSIRLTNSLLSRGCSDNLRCYDGEQKHGIYTGRTSTRQQGFRSNILQNLLKIFEGGMECNR